MNDGLKVKIGTVTGARVVTGMHGDGVEIEVQLDHPLSLATAKYLALPFIGDRHFPGARINARASDPEPRELLIRWEPTFTERWAPGIAERIAADVVGDPFMVPADVGSGGPF